MSTNTDHHPEPDFDYTFAPTHGVHRHLAPGMSARLLAVDVLVKFIQEDFWVSVLACGEDDFYTGRIVTPLRDFPQLAVGSLVTFQLAHVAEMRGETVAA